MPNSYDDEDPYEDEDPNELDETEQTLPVSPVRRKTRRVIGCLFIVAILGLLIWFGVTHTETERMRGFLGMGVDAGNPEPLRQSVASTILR